MQSSGQYDNVESTALAEEDRADNSDVPKIQRESIRTRRERLHGMRVNIERTLAVGVSQELLNGFDFFSIRLQQGDEGVTGRMPADLLVNAICLRNRLDFTLHEIVRPKSNALSELSCPSAFNAKATREYQRLCRWQMAGIVVELSQMGPLAIRTA